MYDLFDLGEFDQKGSVRTKYGTRDEYLQAIEAAHAAAIRGYADVAINHKLGGDHEETFRATPFDPDDRNHPFGKLQTIRAWTHLRLGEDLGAKDRRQRLGRYELDGSREHLLEQVGQGEEPGVALLTCRETNEHVGVAVRTRSGTTASIRVVAP